MLTHKPWTLLQTLKNLPGIVIFGVGMMGLALYGGLLWIKDGLIPRQRDGDSPHDRFADRAIYSDDPSVDPLAGTRP